MTGNPQRGSRWDIGERSPSIAAVQAVAAFRDVKPIEMDDTLHDYVDTDALDALIRESDSDSLTVAVWMGDQFVELRSDGSLDVHESID